jgi:undecaprenyl-diphosphatase
LSFIEGITEFLPVSSTGHMIIASSFFGIAVIYKTFHHCNSTRAILSVVVLYFKRFFQTWDFYFKLFVAFIPAVVLGLLFSDMIDELLESFQSRLPFSFTWRYRFIKVDDWFNHSEDTKVTYLKHLKLGYMPCMVPGVSRSGKHRGWNVP